MKEKQLQPLGREYPPEEGTATHSSVLVRKLSWTQEPGGLQSMRSQRVRHNWSDRGAAAIVSHSTPDIFHQPLHSKISLKEYLWLPSLLPYFMSTQKVRPIWLPLTPTTIPNPTKIRLFYGFIITSDISSVYFNGYWRDLFSVLISLDIFVVF